MADRVGQQFGNYRLVSLLGQGGYAEVYLGQHLRLELQASIKVLHAYLTGQEAEHFQQEAQTIARLTHLAVIRILDYDVQEGIPFLVMDYAPGGSLRQRYPRSKVISLPCPSPFCSNNHCITARRLSCSRSRHSNHLPCCAPLNSGSASSARR